MSMVLEMVSVLPQPANLTQAGVGYCPVCLSEELVYQHTSEHNTCCVNCKDDFLAPENIVGRLPKCPVCRTEIGFENGTAIAEVVRAALALRTNYISPIGPTPPRAVYVAVVCAVAGVSAVIAGTLTSDRVAVFSGISLAGVGTIIPLYHYCRRLYSLCVQR